MDLIRESSFAQYLAENAREEGMKQGIEQGGRERAIEDLIDVLEIRFALAASDPLAGRVGSVGRPHWGHRRCAAPQAVVSGGHTGAQPRSL